jgi:hypothetical protein
VQLPVRGSDDRALAARPGRTAYAALLPRTATAHLPDNSSVLSRARAPAAVHRWVTHASSALPVLVPRPDACRRPGPGAMAQKSTLSLRLCRPAARPTLAARARASESLRERERERERSLLKIKK